MSRIGVASVPLTSRLADAVDAATAAIEHAAVLGAEIDLTRATRQMALRYAPDRIIAV